jgi:hypothetical protein
VRVASPVEGGVSNGFNGFLRKIRQRGRRQKDRSQKSGVRRQKDRSQKSGVRRQKAEGQESGVRRQELEGRRLKAGVRRQGAEGRRQSQSKKFTTRSENQSLLTWRLLAPDSYFQPRDS